MLTGEEQKIIGDVTHELTIIMRQMGLGYKWQSLRMNPEISHQIACMVTEIHHGVANTLMGHSRLERVEKDCLNLACFVKDSLGILGVSGEAGEAVRGVVCSCELLCRTVAQIRAQREGSQVDG